MTTVLKRILASSIIALTLIAGSMVTSSPLNNSASAASAPCFVSGSYAVNPGGGAPRVNQNYSLGEFCMYSGNAKTIFQTDGNLVTYVNGHVYWSSKTSNKNATRLVLQGDGNVVIYRVNIPLWSTNTAGKVGKLQNYIQQFSDGQLNLYTEDACGSGANYHPCNIRKIW